MDKQTATKLLEKIQAEKQGGELADVMAQNSSRSQAFTTILKALGYGAVGGAALRGLSGLNRLARDDAKPMSSRTVDMPVIYPADEEKEKVATSKYSVPWYIPAMLLGTPLAAYGGWKGVDTLLDNQRRKKTDRDLDDAKSDYEKALLGSYKTASAEEASTEELLDQVFNSYEKLAGIEDIWDLIRNVGVTYGLATAPAGYMVVNHMMQKNNKRALLDKAMKERARRQAQQQPAELYAIPHPKEEKKQPERL